ncbi:Uncharacterised protein [Mycobacteroides abscessus subsp. abscessus]|nr:Uncharacterised protein [Mycobacteroides abscessus subsp. abscessus]
MRKATPPSSSVAAAETRSMARCVANRTCSARATVSASLPPFMISVATASIAAIAASSSPTSSIRSAAEPRPCSSTSRTSPLAMPR